MPGIYHFSIDKLLEDLSETAGIKSILLFGTPVKKDASGSLSYDKDGILQKAVKAVKKKFSDLIVITDVCLCGYTSHGHCGVLKSQAAPRLGSGQAGYRSQVKIDNDKTVKVLAKIAFSHAAAGADFVAPSAMMDGQVGAIREALDKNGFEETGILAYSAKYASNFYGPFREALDSAPQFGDRKTYQMDYRNSDEALREIEEDIREGADIVMVKPTLAYLDIIHRVKERFNAPIAAYNVSGEYSMIKEYVGRIADSVERIETEKKLILEILTGVKRAGADLIISYHAKEAAKWLAS
jgi:porphobilinogen synthase